VAATKLTNFFGGSLAGIFLLGMTDRQANGWGAFLGMIAGTAGVAMLAAYTSISWMWHGVFAAALAYASGALSSRFVTGSGGDDCRLTS
jgi:Na+/proline symporter